MDLTTGKYSRQRERELIAGDMIFISVNETAALLHLFIKHYLHFNENLRES